MLYGEDTPNQYQLIATANDFKMNLWCDFGVTLISASVARYYYDADSVTNKFYCFLLTFLLLPTCIGVTLFTDHVIYSHFMYAYNLMTTSASFDASATRESVLGLNSTAPHHLRHSRL